MKASILQLSVMIILKKKTPFQSITSYSVRDQEDQICYPPPHATKSQVVLINCNAMGLFSFVPKQTQLFGCISEGLILVLLKSSKCRAIFDIFPKRQLSLEPLSDFLSNLLLSTISRRRHTLSSLPYLASFEKNECIHVCCLSA